MRVDSTCDVYLSHDDGESYFEAVLPCHGIVAPS